jgi:2-hydroxychromene-2-carboxylate isomerase
VSAGRNVDFFFSSSSPWSYLAFLRLTETAVRTGATISYRPVVAAELRGNAAANFRPADEAAARYAAKDLQDWARFCGAQIASPAPTEIDETQAQCAVLVANEMGRARQYCADLFRARHAQRRNIAERAELLELASGCSLPPADFAARLDAPDIGAQLQRNADELLRRGGFAAPAMFTNNEMFVGHDRMPLLEMALIRASERPFIAPGEHDRL